MFINVDEKTTIIDRRIQDYQPIKEQTPSKLYLEKFLSKVKHLESSSKITIDFLSIDEGLVTAKVTIQNKILKLSTLDQDMIQAIAKEYVMDSVSKLQPQMTILPVPTIHYTKDYELEGEVS